MPRNMSFALTTRQVHNRTKTVTRRLGWKFLKPGDIIQPVVKAMGLRAGEKVQHINGPIRIVSIRQEQLNAITPDDVEREGYPGWTPEQFVKAFCSQARCKPDKEVNRIEFEYLDDEESTPDTS